MGGLKIGNPDDQFANNNAGPGTVIGTPLGGDASGTVPAVTVVGIQTVPVSSTPPTPGQALVDVGGVYTPTTIPGVASNAIWRPVMATNDGGVTWHVVVAGDGTAVMALG